MSSTNTSGLAGFAINCYDYITELPRDPRTPSVEATPESLMRTARAVPRAAYSFVVPETPPEPALECVSPSALALLDLYAAGDDFRLRAWSAEDRDTLVGYLSGAASVPGAKPWAHGYAGHQFGSFAGQLGDGRAISLGQVRNAAGEVWEVQLKGAGNTPYSRFGDGFAVLRSSIREFLCSEHFAALGIPTSRAAVLVQTGQLVHREALEPGAIVTRLAPSWLRFGSFEGFAFRGDTANVARLAEYTLRHVLPGLGTTKSPRTATMFAEIVERTARTVAAWDLVAWEHGVLNTDNMSVLGLTIDYGPFGFLDHYDPDHIVNHSDATGRYTLRNQRAIGMWNLAKLANALVEVAGREVAGSSLAEIAALEPDQVGDADERKKFIELGRQPMVDALTDYDARYAHHYAVGMRAKLGLVTPRDDDHETVVAPLLKVLELGQVDWTRFFRALSRLDVHAHPPLDAETPDDAVEPIVMAAALRAEADTAAACALPGAGSATSPPESRTPAGDAEAAAATKPVGRSADVLAAYRAWRTAYTARATHAGEHATPAARAVAMNAANPKFVLRQWIAQATIEAAETRGDCDAVARALCVMSDPYADVPRGVERFGEVDGRVDWYEAWADEPPSWGKGLVCSCSS
ncbi:hypothetical protein H9P43_004489 [Blastocladiella emersonii ATCC 22665]|nr:hypothetical protein H9P43_004489 [Blastocladiella emersonii ATCC 22665]